MIRNLAAEGKSRIWQQHLLLRGASTKKPKGGQLATTTRTLAGGAYSFPSSSLYLWSGLQSIHNCHHHDHCRYFATQLRSDDDDEEEEIIPLSNPPPPAADAAASGGGGGGLTRSEARRMRVAQLRVELANLGLGTQGTKPELLERLLSSSLMLDDQRRRPTRETKEVEQQEEENIRHHGDDDDCASSRGSPIDTTATVTAEERLLSELSCSLTSDDLEKLTGKKLSSTLVTKKSKAAILEQPTTTRTTTQTVKDNDKPLDVASVLSQSLDEQQQQQQQQKIPDKTSATSIDERDDDDDEEDEDEAIENYEDALSSMSFTSLDVEGVQSSFEALERLLQKDYPPKVKIDLVAEVLTHWQTWLSHHYERQQQQQQQQQSPPPTFNTDDVVNKIWEYQNEYSPESPLWWNRRSYDAILAGYSLEQQQHLQQQQQKHARYKMKDNDNNNNNNSSRRREQQLVAAAAVADQAKIFLMDGIVQDLQERGGAGSDDGPNAKHFQSVIDLCINAEDLDGAMSVLDWLLWKRNRSPRIDGLNFHQLRIDQTIFQRLLQCCVDLPFMPKSSRQHQHQDHDDNDDHHGKHHHHHHQQQQAHRGIMADDIFETLQKFDRSRILGGIIQMEHYTQVVNAWAKSGDPKSVKRAIQIWRFLKTGANKRHRRNDPLAPDGILTNAVLDTLARQGQAELAENFMSKILANKRQTVLRPDIQGFNAVLNAWTKSKKIHAGERAERLLRFMQKEFGLGDVYSYTCVIHAWGTSNHHRAVDRASHLFEEMLVLSETDPTIEPNSATYIAMLNCHAKGGDVIGAARLLNTMCTNYTNGRSVKAIPTEQCFATVMDAMAQSKQRESGIAAETLLRKMESSDIVEGGVGAISYNIVINAWAKSGREDAGMNAERLLREMQTKYTAEGNTRFKPRLDTYNAVMNAWNLSRSASDALRLLREVQQMGENASFSYMKPDRVSYHAVMHAFARDGNPDKNDALLAEMTKQQSKSCEPNPETLKLCVEAWARSGRADCGKKADMYLERLDREHARVPMYLKEWSCKLALSAWEKTIRYSNQPGAKERYDDLKAQLKKIEREKEMTKTRSRSRRERAASF